MGSIDLFKPDPLTAFANRLKKDLGLSVRFRGKRIRTDYSQQPPAVVLPNMERAREEDLEVLMGLCLLEAARCRFTDINVAESIKDYPTKYVFTALQDDYVMRALEPHWDNAREIIVASLIKGREWLESEMRNDLFRNKSFIKATHVVRDLMTHARRQLQITFDTSDYAQVICIAENMEARRVALLWLDDKIGCDIIQSPFLSEWPQHPWKPIFDKITASPANSTKEALGQAMRIIERLGIFPQPLRRPVAIHKKAACNMADFQRPVDEAKNLVKEAEQKQQEAHEASMEVEAKAAEITSKVNERAENTPEYETFEQSKDTVFEASEEVKAQRGRLKKRRHKLKETKRDQRDVKRRIRKTSKEIKASKKDLDEFRKENAEAKKAFESFQPTPHGNNAHGPDLSGKLRNREEYKDALKKAKPLVKKLRGDYSRWRRQEKTLVRREAKTADVQKTVTEQTEVYNGAKNTREEAQTQNDKYRADYGQTWEKINTEVMKVVGWELEALHAKRYKALEAARYVTNKANDLLNYIKRRDEGVEAPLAPGATEKLVDQSFERYKDQEAGEEIAGAKDAEDCNAEIDDKFSSQEDIPPRKYVPFTREYDSIEEIEETADGGLQYDKVVDDLEDIIEKSKCNLKRLYSPYKTQVKMNARRGRFDPRKAVRVILAAKGMPVDVSRVWREIKKTRTPQVAISLLLDCSSSMDRVEGVSLRGMLDADSEELLVPVHDSEPEQYTFQELECGACIWRRVKGQRERYYAKTIEFPFKGKGTSVKDALYDLQEKLAKSEHTRRRVMQKSAAVLAEVLRGLNIPYEIIGHTTRSKSVTKLDFDDEDQTSNRTFSRFAPFSGYIFKGFGSNKTPSSVFSDVDAQDNLDGEGVLWAAQRLCQRSERTKILIALSDGFPFAKFSHEGELQRHLYGVCKLVEAQEKQGLFLWGLGIKADKTGEYFKNANVIQDVKELPEAVLSIVEHVLIKIRGSMA